MEINKFSCCILCITLSCILEGAFANKALHHHIVRSRTKRSAPAALHAIPSFPNSHFNNHPHQDPLHKFKRSLQSHYGEEKELSFFHSAPLSSNGGGLTYAPPAGSQVEHHGINRRSLPSLTQQEVMLDKHNDLRRMVGASDMLMLGWDEDLALLALDWAKLCQWEHGQPDGFKPYSHIGQNLYAGTGSMDLDYAIQLWYDEQVDYDLEDNMCDAGKVCGHYTQLVWASSKTVGCAFHQCSSMSGLPSTFRNANYLVCNYGPAGNWVGQKPYREGDSCTQCNEGNKWCEDGLCDWKCDQTGARCGEPEVTVIGPRKGSLQGGILLTITGENFQGDTFNWGPGNEEKGNLVWLASETHSYVCDIHINGVTTQQITCFTRAMDSGKYRVKVMVDGEMIEDSHMCSGNPYSNKCMFETSESRTPTIEALTPRSGTSKGNIVEIWGRIFSAYYGGTTLAANTTNGVTDKIERVYMGGDNCNLMDENNELLKLTLDGVNGESKYGRFQCIIQSSEVGCMNMSFIVEGDYGRSRTDIDLLRILSDDRICMFEAYSEIGDVSPSVGSTSGGTYLTISGQLLGDNSRYDQTAVIADEECEVVSVTDEEMIILSPEEPGVMPSDFAGNRGWMFESWTGVSKDSASLDDISNLTSSNSGYNMTILDDSAFESDLGESHVARLSGYFVSPKDGEYSFSVTGTSPTKVYISDTDAAADKVEIFSLTTTVSSWQKQSAARFNFIEGNRYYVEVLQSSDASGNFALGVHRFSGTHNSAQSYWARDEKQVIEATAVVLPEMQTLDLSGWPAPQTSINEIQHLEFIAFDDTQPFRLSVDGALTGLLTGSSTAGKIGIALSGLPTVSPDVVTVTISSAGTNYTLDIEFVSNRGVWPLVNMSIPEDSSVALESVSRTTEGISSYTSIVFEAEGEPSSPVPFPPTEEELSDGLLKLYSMRCPASISEPTGYAVYENYEDARDNMLEHGVRTKEQEPYCGTGALSSPVTLFKYDKNTKYDAAINLLTFPWLCIAYKGDFSTSPLRVNMTAKASDGTTLADKEYRYLTFSVIEDGQWHYKCANLMELVRDVYEDVYVALVYEVNFFRASHYRDAIVDVFYVGSQQNDLGYSDKQRLMPPFRAKQVDAVMGENSTYDITITPYECGQPELLVIRNAQNESNYEVTQVQEASDGLFGSFAIKWENHTIYDFGISDSAGDLLAVMETMPGLSGVDMEREGTCSGLTWTITWDALPGEQELMQVTDTSDLGGSNASVIVTRIQSGGTFYNPIPGHLLRTHHVTPQVVIMVNGIPTKCVDGNCSFTWDAALTPTVSSITPTSGAADSSVTIAGTGFSTTILENIVLIGGEICDVTAATAIQLDCTVPVLSSMAHNVTVRVQGKGLATTGGALTFTCTGAIHSIMPNTSGVGGGVTLSILGTGFTASVTVTIGGASCDILTVDTTLITCTVPMGVAGIAAVIVSQASGDLTETYEYDELLTPNITSTSTSTGSPIGGGILVIQGSGFGDFAFSSRAVKIGENFYGHILTYSDTEISVLMPALPHGTHNISVFVEDSGIASMSMLSAILPSLDVVFHVTDVTPLTSSVYGGLTLTVTGDGFSNNTDDNKVQFGHIGCDILSASETEVICKLAYGGYKHIVQNTGLDGRWDLPQIDVKVGDVVRWKWTPAPGTSKLHKIEQTADAVTTSYDGMGFTSEESIAEGVFEHVFTEEGTYYYWSGWSTSDEEETMRGSVTVTEAEAYYAPLSFSIGKIDAQQDVVSSRRKRLSGCSSYNVDGCSSSSPSTLDGTTYDLLLDPCLAGKIDVILPNVGTLTESINITGSGFGDSQACITVEVGGKPCVVDEAAENEILCTINPGNDLSVGIPHEIDVVIEENGYPLLAVSSRIEKYFVALPHIDDVYPKSGSMSGGSLLNITGAGFYDESGEDDIVVTIDGVVCSVVELVYSSILCRTPSSPAEANSTVQVVIKTNLVAECINNNCYYVYEDELTPKVDDVVPLTISDSDNITIIGSEFGSDASIVTVTIGGEDCDVISIEPSQIICNIDQILVGDNEVEVYIEELGIARGTGSFTIVGEPVITSVSPSEGSTEGGTLLDVIGRGFHELDIFVMIDGIVCDLVPDSVTISTLQCITRDHASEVVDVVITSNSIEYPALSYDYSTASTPSVDLVYPAEGQAMDNITVSGTGFSTDMEDNVVYVGDVECILIEVAETSLNCTVDSQPAGSYDITVFVSGKGFASGSETFEYTISLAGISPTSGSFGGGQVIMLTGTGLDAGASITICDLPCPIVITTATSTILECTVPLYPVAAGTEECDLVLTYGSETETLVGGYAYDADLTPAVHGVNPARGGTGGGTRITITGTGFGNSVGDVQVTLAGDSCVVESVTDISILCVTSPHSPTTIADIIVELSGKGTAMLNGTSSQFHYVDVWSSRFTWGGYSPPDEGSLVVIQTGQTVLLDTNTPVLKMLLINGGSLIFDDTQDVELHSENILVMGDGLFQIGTEDEPFQHNALIKMHGHLRVTELPVYGAKTLAVRDGKLELHGRHIATTWTLLESTASPGDSDITLQIPVEWLVGDQIVIASTGGHISQEQNEKRFITAVSGDKLTLTLDEPLVYTHWGVTEDYGDGVTMEVRAEVGLLTHNVKFQGYSDPQWHDEIEACEDGFDPGQFATQTCFQGRFGAEMGSDQHGGCIMIHQTQKSAYRAEAHIEHIEVNYAGQAFRLGRYPIHFHVNGDMDGSYVRGCSIHETFNRAVNIHDTHYVLLQNNVVHDVMGGAIFLEDGIETKNIIEQNFVSFVIPSSSLLTDDLTPAAFWITNPDNYIRGNHAAGGTHFGFWYRMLNHPTGTSVTNSICPRNVELLQFSNNTAHSVGWYGLWVFEFYHPKVGGGCGSGEDSAAIFEKLTAWNCLRGAEWAECGAIMFKDFLTANNDMAGIEMLFIHTQEKYTISAASVVNSTIIGHFSFEDDLRCTATGMVLPFANALLVDGVTFINFDEDVAGGGCSALGTVKVVCVCFVHCSAYDYKFQNVKWMNTDRKVNFEWEHQAELQDLDGSLTGIRGARAVPSSNLYSPDDCTEDAEWSTNMPGSICVNDADFVRFSFNAPIPSSLNGRSVTFENRYGSTSVPQTMLRDIHFEGWMAMLLQGETYTMTWDGVTHYNNFSYTGMFFGLEPGDFVIITHPNVTDSYDSVSVSGSHGELSEPPSYKSAANGEWYLMSDSIGKEPSLSYIISESDNEANDLSLNVAIKLSAYDCFWPDCIIPEFSLEDIPIPGRPEFFKFWSDPNTWASGRVPSDWDDVTIPRDEWIVIDVENIKVKNLVIKGGLEVDYLQERNYVLEAHYIYILGGRLVAGWSDSAFPYNLDIVLIGDKNSKEYKLPSNTGGLPMGAKGIGVFGGLDLHGQARDIYWTSLGITADIGDNTLTLSESVDWKIDEEIVLTSTSYSAWQTETFFITAVSVDKVTLTLNSTLQFKHHGKDTTETLGGHTYDLAAEVGLLTRNIKIIGEENGQTFGARVLVSVQTVMEDADINVYKGTARLNNVEFVRTGQEEYLNLNGDPRMSLVFVNTGLSSGAVPSYVDDCAFHHGYSTAIGVVGSSNFSITGNVIHHTVGEGIHIEGDGHRLIHNLICLTIWPGAYNGKQDKLYPDWTAGIKANMATGLTLINNTVAGAERVGFRLDGESCNPDSEEYGRWTGNKAHAVYAGLFANHDEGDCRQDEGCSRYSDFTITLAYSFGIYFQTSCDLEIENMRLVDNGMSLFSYINGPAASSHIAIDHFVSVKNSLFNGRSQYFDCDVDTIGWSDVNNRLSGQARSWNVNSGSKIGISFAQFAKANMSPEKSWQPTEPVSSYGKLHIEGVTFANFNDICGTRDFVFAPNPGGNNVQHPIKIKAATLIAVTNENKVLYPRPPVGDASLIGCADMQCDGYKTLLIKDEDGSFLSTRGALIPDAAYEYNGDKRFGMGDYRIPKTMQTMTNGTRIPIENVRQDIGIIGNGDCVWLPTSQAFECHTLDYEMILIESMDADAKSRRLAPVAMRGEGYMNLLSGHANVGAACSGYICNVRPSVFWPIIATGFHYDLFFTSTTPQHLRIHFWDGKPTQSFRIGIFYGKQQRLDVFHDGEYILPANGYYASNGRLAYARGDSVNPDDWVDPNGNDSPGSNYLSLDEDVMYVTVVGSSIIDIIMQPVVIVSFDFPTVTFDEFFGENIVQHLALFLNVPPEKVRFVDIISESSRKRRAIVERNPLIKDSKPADRQRRSTGVTARVEIGDHPGEPVISEDTSQLDYSVLSSVSDMLRLGVLTGDLQTYMEDEAGVTIANIKITDPIPLSNDTKAFESFVEYWEDVESGNADAEEEIVQVHSMVLHQLVKPRHEGVTFLQQPKVKLLDEEKNVITTKLMTSDNKPWKILARIVKEEDIGTEVESLADYSLMGQTTVTIEKGWANFTDLGVTHSGVYRLYLVLLGENGFHKSLTSSIVVGPREMSMHASPNTVQVNKPTDLSLSLFDLQLQQTIANPGWKGYTWFVTSTQSSVMEKHTLIRGLDDLPATEISKSESSTKLHNLVFPFAGKYALTVTATSQPENVVIRSEVIITAKAKSEPLSEPQTKQVDLKFDAHFDLVEGREDLFLASVENRLYSGLFNLGVVFIGGTCYEGSIWSSLTMNCTKNDCSTALSRIAALVRLADPMVFEGQDVPFAQAMKVDGVAFQNLDGSSYTPKSDRGSISTDRLVLLVVVPIVCILVAIVITVLIVLFCCKDKKYTEQHKAIAYDDENACSSASSDGRTNITLSFETPPPYESSSEKSSRKSIEGKSNGSDSGGRGSKVSTHSEEKPKHKEPLLKSSRSDKAGRTSSRGGVQNDSRNEVKVSTQKVTAMSPIKSSRKKQKSLLVVPSSAGSSHGRVSPQLSARSPTPESVSLGVVDDDYSTKTGATGCGGAVAGLG